MMYILAFITSSVIGYLTLSLLVKSQKFQGPLRWLLGIALGFGINGCIVFYTDLCFGWYAHWIAPAISVAACGTLIWFRFPLKACGNGNISQNWPAYLLLTVLAFFAAAESLHYPLGGWDAWSCWNLKAKFIYLGGDHWRKLFEPILWRSNTQYPLLLPCINAWFWSWTGGAYNWVPMINSIIFTCLSAGILVFALQEFTKQILLPMALTAAIFLLPFNLTLAAGQYSDILLGLYLLCAFVCLLKEEFIPCAVFIGLLSFTKTEGTACAAILTVLICWQHRTSWKYFTVALIAAGLPTVIFTLSMAPHNEAFVNGLTSALKPSTWQRLQIVLLAPIWEWLGFKWNGIWILLLAALGICWKNAFGKKLRIFAWFFAAYFVILLGYYQINTFFEINWWISTTLSRILFALLPSIALWAALAL